MAERQPNNFGNMINTVNFPDQMRGRTIERFPPVPVQDSERFSRDPRVPFISPELAQAPVPRPRINAFNNQPLPYQHHQPVHTWVPGLPGPVNTGRPTMIPPNTMMATPPAVYAQPGPVMTGRPLINPAHAMMNSPLPGYAQQEPFMGPHPAMIPTHAMMTTPPPILAQRMKEQVDQYKMILHDIRRASGRLVSLTKLVGPLLQWIIPAPLDTDMLSNSRSSNHLVSRLTRASRIRHLQRYTRRPQRERVPRR
jgi:hypothetical protein